MKVKCLDSVDVLIRQMRGSYRAFHKKCLIPAPGLTFLVEIQNANQILCKEQIFRRKLHQ
ncbi:hypothetical protein C7460_11358 [Marinoscillum furvescens DSM 4134]|uniref:Uncharacterized protein n=1 Tax=Marinoscillum furvescens DSM 4134 TaxID=1122208 RepID=A0A3D9L137_MARFU|nr:hypothetical protein C7460_11358 [Marinoscillum furvescens DSM 4134]